MARTQTQLPFERQQRLNLIEGVDPELAGVPLRQWRTIRDLLKQVEQLTWSGRKEIALEVLVDRLAVHRATVIRCRDVAIERGLLKVEHRRHGPRQAPSEWTVQWDALHPLQTPTSKARAELAETPSPHVPSESHRATLKLSSGSHGARSGSHGAQVRVASCDPSKEGPRSTSPVDLFGRQSTGDDDQKKSWKKNSPDPLEVRRAAAELCRQLGGANSYGDWSLAVKAVLLAPRFGEAWLRGAVEGVLRSKTRKRRRWGYFHRCLEEPLAKRHLVLNAELAQTGLPPELAEWRPHETAPEHRDRPRRTAEEAALDAEFRRPAPGEAYVR